MKFDSNYIQAYFLLEKWENMQTSKGLLVYSNIAEDKGGETVFGITRKYHGDLSLWNEVDRIKQLYGNDKYVISNHIMRNRQIVESIKEFYYLNYWLKASCDTITYYPFAANVFLLAVNAGIKRAVKTGQKACLVASDGIIGKDTLTAWSEAGEAETKRFTNIEIQYYKAICDNDPTQIKFLNGWIKRAEAI